MHVVVLSFESWILEYSSWKAFYWTLTNNDELKSFVNGIYVAGDAVEMESQTTTRNVADVRQENKGSGII
jgi:hypothetical protein